jgi:hypothetical protein
MLSRDRIQQKLNPKARSITLGFISYICRVNPAKPLALA